MKSHNYAWIRSAAAMALAVAIGASCGGGDDASEDSADNTAVDESSQPTEPGLGPQPDTTYLGPFDGEPGLTGTVKVVVGESGEEITELLLDLEMNNYSCGDTTMSGGLDLGYTAYNTPIPIEGDTFQVTVEPVTWDGTFESGVRAIGTVEGSLPTGAPGAPPCEFGPFSWTAEAGESTGLDESDG